VPIANRGSAFAAAMKPFRALSGVRPQCRFPTRARSRTPLRRGIVGRIRKVETTADHHELDAVCDLRPGCLDRLAAVEVLVRYFADDLGLGLVWLCGPTCTLSEHRHDEKPSSRGKIQLVSD